MFPYAFRHTFCQRYADAGVPLHVLQSLMDHKSANTTSAYYQVSKKMKRAAVDTLRLHAINRHGGAAPMGSAGAAPARSASNAPDARHTDPTRHICLPSRTRSAVSRRIWRWPV
ncbi:MAG: tyrosine-type recombinase/integrase [Pseudonocardia sp.]